MQYDGAKRRQSSVNTEQAVPPSLGLGVEQAIEGVGVGLLQLTGKEQRFQINRQRSQTVLQGLLSNTAGLGGNLAFAPF